MIIIIIIIIIITIIIIIIIIIMCQRCLPATGHAERVHKMCGRLERRGRFKCVLNMYGVEYVRHTNSLFLTLTCGIFVPHIDLTWCRLLKSLLSYVMQL